MPALPQRDALKRLQLDCPDYDIEPKVIYGENFYVATADPDSEVSPRFAQAQSVERLRQKLTGCKEFLGASRPNIARVYYDLLGGKDAFTIDKVQADQVLDVAPHARIIAREGRALHTRIVAQMARLGIDGFADLGCGLPVHPATHETAQAVRPDARVVYVDNDPMVLTHAHALMEHEATGVTVAGGDIEYPREIFYDPIVRDALGFGKPVGVLLSFMLHFYSAAESRRIIAETANSLPTGSYLSVSVVHATSEETRREAARAYTTAKWYSHELGDMMEIMGGLSFLDAWNPGIVDARSWPNRDVTPGGYTDREVETLVGVAQKITELK